MEINEIFFNTSSHRIKIRRFITLIDVLYENAILVVALAEASPINLFRLSKEERADSAYDEVAILSSYKLF